MLRLMDSLLCSQRQFEASGLVPPCYKSHEIGRTVFWRSERKRGEPTELQVDVDTIHHIFSSLLPFPATSFALINHHKVAHI
jgi:hypothetical protein